MSSEPPINDESEGISKRLAVLHAQSEVAASAAGVAKESAESAAAAAATAKNTAEAEATAAASAKVVAEAASVAATTARISVETDATAVTAARSTAEGAAVAATNAKNTAEPASAAAVTAKGAAETAADAAITAKNTAEPAATAAAIAKETAEAAAAAAAAAKSTAETEAASITAAKQVALSDSQNATGAAIAADARLQEIRRTLENSITASLGGAFQLKADNAKKLDLAWLFVLMIGIAGIICFGLLRYPAMIALIQERAEVEYLIFQFLLSIASLAGPIWLSWVATKRLARTFAISEDYAYKAAIAQAYQGYRDSVKDADPLMQQRLFASVVTQLDANPVRFLSDRHAATPIQDLLQQQWMEQIINSDKTFKEKLTAWFKYTYGTFLGDKG